jgi:hypothetical protein
MKLWPLDQNIQKERKESELFTLIPDPSVFRQWIAASTLNLGVFETPTLPSQIRKGLIEALKKRLTFPDR